MYVSALPKECVCLLKMNIWHTPMQKKRKRTRCILMIPAYPHNVVSGFDKLIKKVVNRPSVVQARFLHVEYRKVPCFSPCPCSPVAYINLRWK